MMGFLRILREGLAQCQGFAVAQILLFCENVSHLIISKKDFLSNHDIV